MSRSDVRLTCHSRRALRSKAKEGNPSGARRRANKSFAPQTCLRFSSHGKTGTA